MSQTRHYPLDSTSSTLHPQNDSIIDYTVPSHTVDYSSLFRRHALTEDDNGRGAIPDLLVLGAAKLDHALRCRVSHVNLNVVCTYNVIKHRIYTT